MTDPRPEAIALRKLVLAKRPANSDPMNVIPQMEAIIGIPQVQRMLFLGTCHAPSEEAVRTLHVDKQINAIPHPNGVFIWVPDDAVDDLRTPPHWTDDLFLLAAQLGCEWVNLDEAGPELADLPRWDW